MSFAVKTITLLIKGYQKTLSFETGVARYFIPEGSQKVCIYYPSCSTYTMLAVQKHGALKGVTLGLQRLLSCRPGKNPAIDFP